MPDKRPSAGQAEYLRGFEAGYKAHFDEIRSNYDKWLRARERQDMKGSIYDVQALAVRQVIYDNELGKRPDETEEQEDA